MLHWKPNPIFFPCWTNRYFIIFHTYNAAKTSNEPGSDDSSKEIFAESPENVTNKRGWVVDYIKKYILL